MGVLLNKPRSYSEVYNDLDGVVVDAFEQMLTLQQGAVPLLQAEPVAHAGYCSPVDAWQR